MIYVVFKKPNKASELSVKRPVPPNMPTLKGPSVCVIGALAFSRAVRAKWVNFVPIDFWFFSCKLGLETLLGII